MNNNELQLKIEHLIQDAHFTAKLSMCSTPAEMADLFTREGVSVSAEEMERIIAMASVPAGGELDENALDGVTGGTMLLGRVGLLLMPLFPKLPITLPVVPIKKFKK